MVTKACTRCHRLMEEDKCAVCNMATSKNWSGFLIIVILKTHPLPRNYRSHYLENMH